MGRSFEGAGRPPVSPCGIGAGNGARNSTPAWKWGTAMSPFGCFHALPPEELLSGLPHHILVPGVGGRLVLDVDGLLPREASLLVRPYRPRVVRRRRDDRHLRPHLAEHDLPQKGPDDRRSEPAVSHPRLANEQVDPDGARIHLHLASVVRMGVDHVTLDIAGVATVELDDEAPIRTFAPNGSGVLLAQRLQRGGVGLVPRRDVRILEPPLEHHEIILLQGPKGDLRGISHVRLHRSASWPYRASSIIDAVNHHDGMSRSPHRGGAGRMRQRQRSPILSLLQLALTGY